MQGGTYDQMDRQCIWRISATPELPDGFQLAASDCKFAAARWAGGEWSGVDDP